LENIELSFPGGYLVVVTPPIQVNTAEAYSMLKPKTPSSDLKEALAQNIAQWPQSITNDFEAPVFKQFSILARTKEILLKQGALYASLSGSGSSVYGIFKEKPDLTSWFGADCLVWEQGL